MLDISKNGIITVNRGDTFTTILFINVGSLMEPVRYKLRAGDKLYLGVCEPNQPFECAVIKKVFTNADLNEDNDVIVKFKAEDTENILPGVYYYEAKLFVCYKAETETEPEQPETINTVVPKTKFIILE